MEGLAVWLLIAAILIAIGLLWWVFPGPLARVFLALERLQAGLTSSHRHGWHYLEGGRGEPLVLLHGFNADAHHFCQASRWLGAHFRIIAPDLPGFGDTELAPGSSLRIEDRAREVLDWLDRQGIHEFYLGGSSMGGYLSLAMARQAPDRVRALWLLAPGGLHSARHSAVFEEVAEGRHNPLIVRHRADFLRLIDYCFVRPPWIPGPLQRYLAQRGQRTAEQAERLFDAMRHESEPVETLARGLATPTLLIWGQADQVLHPEGASVVRSLLSDCESLILPSVGHLPMIEDARTCAEAWIAFTEGRARKATGAG
jgi:pimeloyl-ACP methyl ester carboxylesterase